MKAMLVYQAGIANVFSIECFNLADFGRDAQLLYQGAFQGAANFTLGMQAAGVIVKTAACNQAGDISNALWSQDLDSQPFSDKYIVVETKGKRT